MEQPQVPACISTLYDLIKPTSFLNSRSNSCALKCSRKCIWRHYFCWSVDQTYVSRFSELIIILKRLNAVIKSISPSGAIDLDIIDVGFPWFRCSLLSDARKFIQINAGILFCRIAAYLSFTGATETLYCSGACPQLAMPLEAYDIISILKCSNTNIYTVEIGLHFLPQLCMQLNPKYSSYLSFSTAQSSAEYRESPAMYSALTQQFLTWLCHLAYRKQHNAVHLPSCNRSTLPAASLRIRHTQRRLVGKVCRLHRWHSPSKCRRTCSLNCS
jgi:hypothetical protein